MTWVIICILIFLIVLFSYSAWVRKQIYNEVDRLDEWKMELMSRPVAEEISKLKKLQMKGQTEEKFEKWRKEWDDILTIYMPNVEEHIFDAEQSADKYRFSKAKDLLQRVDQQLKMIEKNIESILNEVETVLESSEANEHDYVEVETMLRDAKRTLLAHQLSFGKTLPYFEDELKRLKEMFANFKQLTDNGDYLSAREVLVHLKDDLAKLDQQMTDVPELLTNLKTNIPSTLDELERGYKEMEEQQFDVSYLAIPKTIAAIQSALPELMEKLIHMEIKPVQESVQEIEEQLNEMYDQLEKEVYAKQYVLKETGKFSTLIDQMQNDIAALQAETEEVQESYHLQETDLEVQRYLNRELMLVTKKFQLLLQSLDSEKKSYSLLRQTLDEIERKLKDLSESNQEYKNMLQTLRKDEFEAKQQVKSMRRMLLEIHRDIQTSHLPGLPKQFEDFIDKTDEKVAQVSYKLAEKPLQMNHVNELLNEAKTLVEEAKKQTDEMLEQVKIAELLIQYGNRFRRKSQEIAHQLDEAESHFRHCRYNDAIEEVAFVIEKIEPGALRKLNITI